MTSDTGHIHSRQGLRWTILAYAIFPALIYLYFVGMGWVHMAEDGFPYGWDEMIFSIALDASLLCASAVSVYLFAALRASNVQSGPAFWPITKIHLRALFGFLVVLFFPVSSVMTFIDNAPKYQPAASEETPYPIFETIAAIVGLGFAFIVVLIIISWAVSLLRGIPAAIQNLTASPNPQ